MIIACPACNTRYVVPDEAIGIDGRTVRCAKCKHSWFQDGPEVELPQREEAAPAAPPPSAPPAAPPETADETAEARETDAARGEDDAPAQPSVSHWKVQRPPSGDDDQITEDAGPETGGEGPDEPGDEDPGYVSVAPRGLRRSGEDVPVSRAGADEDIRVEGEASEAAPAAEPAADEPATPQPVADETAVQSEPKTFYYDEAEPSQFDYEPPFRPRRNPLKLWTAGAIVFAIAAFGIVAAVSYWGLPSWVPVSRPTFAINQPELQLDFPADQQDRRTLPNGTEYFGARGTVTNIGRETVSVPPILIVLRDEMDRIVYTWEIRPPQSSLAPGETVTIREAMTDVPRSARYVEIGWKPS